MAAASETAPQNTRAIVQRSDSIAGAARKETILHSPPGDVLSQIRDLLTEIRDQNAEIVLKLEAIL